MVHHLRKAVTDTYRRTADSQTTVALIPALLAGTGSGYATVAFHWLMTRAHAFFFGWLKVWLESAVSLGPFGLYTIVVIPALGGLLFGLLANRLAPEARGPGVAPVMESLALHDGRMRAILIATEPVATSLTIGSGGSNGRHGPIVQTGSAIGSLLSQTVRLPEEKRKNLVACGAAGGIASTFNAPLAGIMFALEVLLMDFGLLQFANVVVAAVVASLVVRAHLGDAPAYPLLLSATPHAWELPIHAALGAAAAVVGVVFTRILHFVADLFDSHPWPTSLKPAMGGLLVGVIGLWFPRVLGLGHETIEAVLFNELAVTTLVILGLLKVIATALTVGSGGSGGIFRPRLFIGSMLGSSIGQAVQGVSVGAAPSSVYAVVGVSAVFAAASRAPISAVLTVFELTRDYNLILPLMLASVIAAILARQLLQDTIYTVKITRRGIDVRPGRDLDLMDAVLVQDAMTSQADMTSVGPWTPLTELARLFQETQQDGAATSE